MAIVKIPFREQFREAMLNGVKTCTSRPKLYGMNGDLFEAFGAKFRITFSSNVPVGYVAYHMYKQEGFEGPLGFWKVWQTIHPRKPDGDRQVWLHEFKRTSC